MLIVVAVAFEGHRNVVCGLWCKFIATFSLDILSSLSDTRAFLFSRLICLFVGSPFLKVSGK